MCEHINTGIHAEKVQIVRSGPSFLESEEKFLNKVVKIWFLFVSVGE